MARLDNNCLLMIVLLTNDLRTLPKDQHSWIGVTGRFTRSLFAQNMDDHGRALANEYRQERLGKFKSDAAAIAQVC